MTASYGSIRLVTNLQYVWFWPNGGHRDGIWGDDNSRGVDRFARTSRRVTERYSEGLQQHQIPAARMAIQMHAFRARQPTSDVIVNVARKPFEGNESVRVDVPEIVADLAAPQRALLVLDVVTAAMNTIADLRGRSSSPFESARQHAIDHHLSFEIAGPWKSNRKRDLRARPIVRLTDEGFGEKAFEIADRDTGATLGFTEAETSPVNSAPRFNRDIREWRWSDAATIECPDGWQMRIGSGWGNLTHFDASDLREWTPVYEEVPQRAPLEVIVRYM